ncbi:MAG: peptidylprolyl isomerase [Actinomycetota bacterium]
MTPLSGRSRMLVAGLGALAMLLTACNEGRLEPPAAKIDDAAITENRLDAAIREFRFLSALNQTPCGQPIEGESQAAACARFTLSNLIQEELIASYAREQQLEVGAQAITAAIAEIEGQIGADAVADQLAAEGLTPEDLQAFVGRLLLFQEVQRVISDEEITDATIRRSYEERSLEFTQLHAKHILVETQQEALDIARQATPNSFEDLAREFSIEPNVGQSGGDLGEQQAASFDPAFANAAAALEPGEISEPVQTEFGWHVVLLVSADRVPFGQVRDQLLQELAPTVFAEWFDARLLDADIDVNPRYGRMNPQTQLVEPIRTTSTSSPTPSPASTGPVDVGAPPQG